MSLRDSHGALSGLDGYSRRKRSAAGRWLLAGLLLAAGAAAGVLGYRAWQRSLDDWRAEAAALRAELEAANGRVAELDGRLAALDAAAHSAAGREAALQSAVDGLAAEVAALKAGSAAAPGGEAPAAGGSAAIPPEVHLSVARQTQSHSLSCESSAASMAAQYLGVPLTEADVLAALPRSANPHLGFRGNIDGPTGGIDDYGVYAEPVAAVLSARGLRATLVEGGPDGIKAALARGNPVVAWITYNCRVSAPVRVSIEGQDVALVPQQHAVVVTGYTAEGVWANDPYDGAEDFYAAADFERALGYFGDMAIEVARP